MDMSVIVFGEEYPTGTPNIIIVHSKDRTISNGDTGYYRIKLYQCFYLYMFWYTVVFEYIFLIYNFGRNITLINRNIENILFGLYNHEMILVSVSHITIL